MKKLVITFFIGIFILSLSSFLLAEELQEVFQKQYDEAIENVILGTTEITVEKAQALGFKKIIGRSSDKVKVDAPKVLISKKSLKFIENGYIKKEIAIGDEAQTYLVNSPELTKLGYVKSNIKRLEEKGIGVVDSSILTIVDNSGNEVMNKSFEGGRDFVVSDDGSFVTFESEEGIGYSIYFYNSQGVLTKQLAPFEMRKDKGTQATLYWSHLGSYSKTGNYVVISFDKYGEMGGAIILFDLQGNELWRKELIELDNTVSEIKMSQNGKYISLSGSFYLDNTYKQFKQYYYLFDVNGNKILEKKNGESGVFSAEGDYLCLLNNNKIELLDIKNSKTLYTYIDSNSAVSINSVDISNNAEYLVASMRQNGMENIKVLLLNKEGQIIFKKDYISEDKTADNVLAKIEKTGKKLYIMNGNKLEILNISK